MTLVPEWAKWVARDIYGNLVVYDNKPKKSTNVGRWVSRDKCKATVINDTDKSFAHVSWYDEEPTPIKTVSGEDVPTGFHRLENELTKETVNHPDHYQGNKFEVIDIIEDYNLGFNLGNVIKYTLRADHKGNKVEDLKKAIWYLNRELEREGG